MVIYCNSEAKAWLSGAEGKEVKIKTEKEVPSVKKRGGEGCGN
jgi:hypothetical protein